MDFDLVEQLKVSLFENSIDVAIDFAEIGLDNLLSDITDSEILQEIPIIKTIYSVCKFGLARLISIGLFENHNRLGGDIVLSGGDSSVGQEANKDVDVTEIGVIYSKYGLELSF